MGAELEKEEMLALAECMIDFVNKHNPNTNDYNVLLFVAKETARKLSLNIEIEDVKFTSADILKGIVPASEETNSSNWLNPIFNKLDQKLRFEIEEPLSNFASEKGLEQFPWIQKQSTDGGKGNKSKYWLVGLPLIEGSLKRTKKFEPKEGEIKYTAVKRVDGSFIAKILFGKSMAISDWRKWVLIFYPIITVIFFVILAFVIYLGWINPKPITTQDLSEIVCLIVVIWFAKNTKERTDRFLDDRVIIASELLMKHKEYGCLQELVTIEDSDSNFIRKDIRLIKYVSKCPICDEEVYLDRGEPDYPRRIVGRCKQSPREHVFTFDRVTLIGRKTSKV